MSTYYLVDLTTDARRGEEFADEGKAIEWVNDFLPFDTPYGILSEIENDYVAIVFQDETWRPS